MSTSAIVTRVNGWRDMTPAELQAALVEKSKQKTDEEGIDEVELCLDRE